MAIQFLPIITSQAARQAAGFVIGSVGDATSPRPAIGIDISSNMRQFQKSLNSFERKQLPFAISKTLNDTAFQVRKTVTGPTYSRAFDVKNRKFAGQSFRVFKATKKNLEASVTQVKIRGYYRGNLRMHAKGGIKTPKSGNLAIPSTFMKGKKTRTGRIGQANRPRQLLEKDKTFIARTRDGGRGIWRRRTKKRYPIDLMYSFSKTARITKSYLFFEDGTKVVRKKLGRNFSRAFNYALKTARR